MSRVSSEQLRAQEEEMILRMQGLNPVDRTLLALTSEHIANGSTWGFDNDLEDNGITMDAIIDYCKTQPEFGRTFVPFKLTNGAHVIDVLDVNRAFTAMRTLLNDDEVSYKQMLINATTRRNRALGDIMTYMQNRKSGSVSFFNTNDSDVFTIRGATYPAFRLGARDFLGVSVTNHYKFKVPDGRVISAKDAKENIVEFMSLLTKTPSSNGVMVTLLA